tara:strand:+ start:959 stop:1093 length:135 start_codon:yes stop_codon:yes gene_type:complete
MTALLFQGANMVAGVSGITLCIVLIRSVRGFIEGVGPARDIDRD